MTNKEAFNFIISILLRVTTTGATHEKINEAMSIIKGYMCLNEQNRTVAEIMKEDASVQTLNRVETHKVTK